MSHESLWPPKPQLKCAFLRICPDVISDECQCNWQLLIPSSRVVERELLDVAFQNLHSCLSTTICPRVIRGCWVRFYSSILVESGRRSAHQLRPAVALDDVPSVLARRSFSQVIKDRRCRRLLAFLRCLSLVLETSSWCP